ncbi:hypothetical protein BDD12DRAFT_85105 [Trichophaea hybrida]|nr:hypothetical protein BDD12DRAFT_85105 [Trichophaea hybrida]
MGLFIWFNIFWIVLRWAVTCLLGGILMAYPVEILQGLRTFNGSGYGKGLSLHDISLYFSFVLLDSSNLHQPS